MGTNPTASAREETVHIFVSYAREDGRWMDPGNRYNLVPFLAESLRRLNTTFWFDKKLVGGDEFRRHIEAEIDQSQIALLIVSQNFLNSEFIEIHEMPRIAERAQQGKLIVVPVLVEPCAWSDYPFLADRQMVPSADPLIDYTESEAKWARVKFQILDQIKTQVKRIREAQQEAVDENRKPEAPGSTVTSQSTQPPAVIPQPAVAEVRKPAASAPVPAQEKATETYDVYLSHSYKNQTIANEVCAALEAQALRCWMASRDAVPGLEWEKGVQDAIRRSKVMVLVFTADSNASPRIRREVEFAIGARLVMVPVRFDNVEAAPEISYFLGSQNWLDASTPPLDEHLRVLAENIKRLLSHTGSHNRDAPVAYESKRPVSGTPPFLAETFPGIVRTKAPVEYPRIPEPAEIGPVAQVGPSEDASTRKSGEWQAGGVTVSRSRFGKIPVWAWGGGIAAVLLLGVVFVGVQSVSHSGAPAPQPGGAAAPEYPGSPAPVQSNPEPEAAPAEAPTGDTTPVHRGFNPGEHPATAAPQAAAGNGESLADTMKFIQDSLSGIGTIKFVASVRNSTNGSTFQYTDSYEISNVVADPSQCRVSFHYREWQNGSANQDKDAWFILSSVESVAVEPEQQNITAVAAANGTPNIVVTNTNPSVTALLVRSNGNGINLLPFADVGLANRVAAAINHAAKLCGGEK